MRQTQTVDATFPKPVLQTGLSEKMSQPTFTL
jgi:hypothetical protein